MQGLGLSPLADHLVSEINQGPCYVKIFPYTVPSILSRRMYISKGFRASVETKKNFNLVKSHVSFAAFTGEPGAERMTRIPAQCDKHDVEQAC